MTPKIVTCSYCGTRAALVLDRASHGLICASCGAPLCAIKVMPERQHPSRHMLKRGKAPTRKKGCAAPKPDKRRGFRKGMLKDVWEILEDVFD